MAVMIGVDPHKGSHTAVAIGADEEPLGQLRVRASAAQAQQACDVGRGAGPSGPGRWRAPAGWGTCWPSNWSLLGNKCWTCSLSWPPGSGCWRPASTNKNDPNDALSVAIAALRSKARRQVRADDYAALVHRAKRHRDLSRARNQVACRLHAGL